MNRLSPEQIAGELLLRLDASESLLKFIEG